MRSRTYLTPNRHEKYMIVDGYNVINAWDFLQKISNEDLAFARDKLIHLLMEFGQYEKYDVTIVFDAQYTNTEENVEEITPHCKVVYTKEKETADSYIERLVAQVPKYRAVRVATSDGLEQSQVLSTGATRLTARELLREAHETRRRGFAEHRARAERHRNPLMERLSPDQYAALEKLRRSK